ncbi:MAG: hypothetical protein HZC01_02300 [Candidatus Kerfeldbacteria bacterium]|nr:hypothetical protein [Candidatus Kerfeldbacteria bacterium]
MDQKTPLHHKAQQIAQERGFHIRKKIYEAWEPGRPIPRNIIYLGTWQDKPAAFKIYDERRLSDEPLALQAWLQHSTSTQLIAPALYDFAIASPHAGWLIMEELPTPGGFFASPLSVEARERFLQLYQWYRVEFPKQPTRQLSLAEKLPAAEYHQYRIYRWFEQAVHAEEARRLRHQPTLLSETEFPLLFRRAMAIIGKLFAGRAMVWSHGHFKPKELYHDETRDRYYLTDFAHVKMYPEGYELGFMVWADYLMSGDWRLPYAEWALPVRSWRRRLVRVAIGLGLREPAELIRGSLIERSLGTILADIVAREQPIEQQKKHLALLMQLLTELVTDIR